MPELPDDEILMHRVKVGDRDALEALVRRYAASLLSYLGRVSGDRGIAEDVFQDVWLAVWAKRRTFDAARRFKPWMFRIATNASVDAHRRHQRMLSARRASVALGRGRSGDAPMDTIEQDERLRAASDAIGRLPRAQREVVSLRLYASMEYAEIASVLQLTESAVRSSMSRALAHLRGELRCWVDARAAEPVPGGRTPEESSNERA